MSQCDQARRVPMRLLMIRARHQRSDLTHTESLALADAFAIRGHEWRRSRLGLRHPHVVACDTLAPVRRTTRAERPQGFPQESAIDIIRTRFRNRRAAFDPKARDFRWINPDGDRKVARAAGSNCDLL